MKYWEIVKAFEEGKDVVFQIYVWNKSDDDMEEFLDHLRDVENINDVKIVPTKEESAKEIHNQLIEFYYTEEEEKAIALIKSLL